MCAYEIEMKQRIQEKIGSARREKRRVKKKKHTGVQEVAEQKQKRRVNTMNIRRKLIASWPIKVSNIQIKDITLLESIDNICAFSRVFRTKTVLSGLWSRGAD